MAIISQVKNKEQLIKLKNRKHIYSKVFKVLFVLQTVAIIYLLSVK